MSMSSALVAGVTGLGVNSSRLASISDNIANSSTIGYKRAKVEFSSVVLGATAGQYSAGGVRSTAGRLVDARGSLVSTTNSTDLAIAGRGLLPVTSVPERNAPVATRPLMLTSTGSFTQDELGYLRTDSGLQLLGWETTGGVTPTGVTRSSQTDLKPVQITGFDFGAEPTQNIQAGINLPASAANTTQFTTGVEYFDALGASQTLQLRFTKTAADTWTLTYDDSQGPTTFGNFVVTLNFHPTTTTTGTDPGEAGSLADVTLTTNPGTEMVHVNDSGTVTIPVGPTGTRQLINLNFGEEDKLGALTQFASGFAPVGLEKDGFAVGTLARIEVSEDGFVQTIYDTGLRRTVFQIPIADVPNLNGLTAVDNQAYLVSSESGGFYLWDAGSGPTGNMIGFALEQSTVDIAGELTQLIETQRAYSSNATIVRTVDEMLQETTNLKR